MKRMNIITGIIIVVAVSIAAQSSFGQSSAGLRFTTDFDFYVQGDKFPAGNYTVEKRISATENNTVAIRSEDGKFRRVYMLVPPSSHRTSSSAPVVTFYRYAGEYFLAEMRNPRRGFSARISGSKREKMRAQNMTAEKVFLRAD